jgi:hypothetical protein
MKYTFKRAGSPDKLRQLLLRENSLRPAFKDMRSGLLEDIAEAKAEGAVFIRASLCVSHQGAHSCVTVIK